MLQRVESLGYQEKPHVGSSSLPHCWINETVLNFRDLIKAARVININLLKLFHLVQGICILRPYNFFFFFLHLSDRRNCWPQLSHFLGSLQCEETGLGSAGRAGGKREHSADSKRLPERPPRCHSISIVASLWEGWLLTPRSPHLE